MVSFVSKRVFTVGSLLLGGILTTACATGEYGPYPDDRVYEPQVYITGCWEFRDANGVIQANYIEELDEYTIIVEAVSRDGSAYQFNLQSDNLYQSAGSGVHTYQFAPNGRAIYRNNEKNRTIRLTYASSRC